MPNDSITGGVHVLLQACLETTEALVMTNQFESSHTGLCQIAFHCACLSSVVSGHNQLAPTLNLHPHSPWNHTHKNLVDCSHSRPLYL